MTASRRRPLSGSAAQAVFCGRDDGVLGRRVRGHRRGLGGVEPTEVLGRPGTAARAHHRDPHRVEARLGAVARSRCAKSLVLAMCRDQSAAMLARSGSQVSASRPLALRSALRRANSSWVILSATVLARLVAGELVEDGARVVVLGGLVVVGAAVVVGALVVVAAGLRLGLVVRGCAA